MANNSGGRFMAGFVLGGLIGSTTALLFAPQKGEETVAMVREKGIEIKQRLDELSPEEVKKTIKAGVEEAIDEGRMAAARTKEDLVSKLDEVTIPAGAESAAETQSE